MMIRTRFFLLMVSICFSTTQAVEISQDLVVDLKSDDVKWNASSAIYQLKSMFNPPVMDLEAALFSEDYQQRQSAAEVLRYHFPDEASTQLLAVSIEGLRDDTLPHGRKNGSYSYTYVFNASRGTVFLVRHGLKAKDLLLPQLQSDDSQQQFLCAYILGMNGIQDNLPKTVSVLLPHLRDNNIMYDACLAVAALYRLGPATIPLLKEAAPAADKQQKELIDLMLLDFQSPPHEKRDFYFRKTLQHVSCTMHDPAFEGDIRRFIFPYGIDRKE